MADFYETVLSQLKGATIWEKEAIRAELEAHVTDHVQALEEKGMDHVEAKAKALDAMGDPEEIGKALRKLYAPFWLWAKRLAQVAVCFLLVFMLIPAGVERYADYIGAPWYVLRGITENWQVRRGNAWEVVDAPVPNPNTTHFWQCWEVMRVGEDLVCLTGVELEPYVLRPDLDLYDAYFYFCTYNDDLLAPAKSRLLPQLTVTPEGGPFTEEKLQWWGGWLFGSDSYGVAEAHYQCLVRAGDTYVDVTYDRMGTYATMRVPLTWEEVSP